MAFQITGKNLDAGEAFKSYVSEKLSASFEKYVGPGVSGHVRLEKERGRFRTDCSLRLPSGLMLEAHGDGSDAYASADAAVERLEARLRRHKRRLKNHHASHSAAPKALGYLARDSVVQVGDADAGDDAAASGPVIVAETEREISEMSVSEAVMRLDFLDAPFLIFRNAAHGGFNVVYRRPDGHVGWVDQKPVVASPEGDDGAKVSQSS
jgi:ribosomal subunit interface protein